MKRNTLFIAVGFQLLLYRISGFSQEQSMPYLGQTPPGDKPEIFAPGIVSVEGKNSHALVVSPDGKAIIFSRYPDRTSYILSFENGKWSGPKESFFYGKEVSFSSNGNRIYYYTDGDVFYVQQQTVEWSAPIRLGASVNTGATEYYPSIVKSGDLYFSRDGNWSTGRLMKSECVNGEFQPAVDLGLPINSGGALHAWVAPDENHLLFNSPRQGSHTKLDIWISFRNRNGTWSDPKNLGETINSGADAILCPTVSPDGRYLFFTRLNFGKDGGSTTGFIYWVNARILDAFKE